MKDLFGPAFKQRLVDFTGPTVTMTWKPNHSFLTQEGWDKAETVTSTGLLSYVLDRYQKKYRPDPSSVMIEWYAWDMRLPPGMEPSYIVTSSEGIESGRAGGRGFLCGNWPGDPHAPRDATDAPQHETWAERMERWK